jgi:2,3-bisphosphoglycerate-dependent phosphoglycerate mutase
MPEEYRQHPFVVPPDATEVVLARHGASQPIRPGERFPLLDGVGDPPLAPEGHAQAALLARRLEGEDIAAVFVTGLRRTIETAAPLGRETVEVAELREVDLGEWEGGEFRIRFRKGDPVALRTVTEERWDVIPGAESMDGFAERVRTGIEKVVETTGPGRVALVFAHGGVIGEACRQATASRPFAFVHSDNCSLTRLVRFADGRWLLRSFNDTTHLATRPDSADVPASKPGMVPVAGARASADAPREKRP